MVDRSDFIRDIVREDLQTGRTDRVVTRFPPEPNGYLHIGHAKAILLDFSVAAEFGGACNLRFDDTNPVKEEPEFVEAIKRDVAWLGCSWEGREYHASDYFDRLWETAKDLVRRGLAYVDSLSPEEIRNYRGTLTEPGRESPFRDRSAEESLEIMERMRKGEFPEGAHVVRARIDMASPNLNMRDPVIYRILHADHHRTGDSWRVYPMYDFTHPLSDAFEGVTHSFCTLEFEDHRPLYDWVIEAAGTKARPRQIEFARLELTQTVLSKRRLTALVEEGVVKGWDDPRMPTLAGLKRRGYTPEAIRDFCDRIGVAKTNSVVDIRLLEHCLREDLNRRAKRVMAVLDPVRVVIENYPEGKTEEFEVENNPEDPGAGTRRVEFSREIWIERADYMEDPPRKFRRLSPGSEVRLKGAYFIEAMGSEKDENGRITRIIARYDPASRGGEAPDGRRPGATIHWVSTSSAVPIRARLFGYLFATENPDEGGDWRANIDPDSMIEVEGLGEAALGAAKAGDIFQFLRTGYFIKDPDPGEDGLVFNRAVSLKDPWARSLKKAGG